MIQAAQREAVGDIDPLSQSPGVCIPREVWGLWDVHGEHWLSTSNVPGERAKLAYFTAFDAVVAAETIRADCDIEVLAVRMFPHGREV